MSESGENQRESSSGHIPCECDRSIVELYACVEGPHFAALASEFPFMEVEEHSLVLCNVPEVETTDKLFGRRCRLRCIRTACSTTFALPLLRGVQGRYLVASARALWIFLHDLAWTLRPSLRGLPFTHCEASRQKGACMCVCMCQRACKEFEPDKRCCGNNNREGGNSP